MPPLPCPEIRAGFRDLPSEVLGQIVRWLEARERSSLEVCASWLLSEVRHQHWLNAGPLCLGSGFSPEARTQLRASDRWLHERGAKVFAMGSWGDLSTRFTQESDSKQASLLMIGHDAGRRFSHINADSCYQPVVTGIVQTCGWRSLSLCYKRSQWQQGLEEVMASLAGGDPLRRRELSLQIVECGDASPVRLPEGWHAAGLDLVDLSLDDLIDPAAVLPAFKDERSLLRLAVVMDAGAEDPAAAITAIGGSFPELRFFLLSAAAPFGIAPNVFSSFLLQHPKLDVLKIQHLQLGSHGEALDFSALGVRELELMDFFPADPGGRLAAWIKDSHSLAVLDIELSDEHVDSRDPEPTLVRDRLLEAMVANCSLERLSLKGHRWSMDTDHHSLCAAWLSFLDRLASGPRLKALQIPAFGIDNLADLHNAAPLLRESGLMSRLETLERRMPGLRLTLGSYTLGTIHRRVSVSAEWPEFLRALDDWKGLDQKPAAGEVLEFTVRMPLWGDGALGRFITFCTMQDDERQHYLIECAKAGALVEGSLCIAPIVTV